MNTARISGVRPGSRVPHSSARTTAAVAAVGARRLPARRPARQTALTWGGAQRWLKSDAAANVIRAVVAATGGHATLFRGGDKSVGVFHPLPDALMKYHRRLKDQFDPAGILNPGRLYPEF